MIICPKCRTNNHGGAQFCESCGKSLRSLQEADDAIERMLLKEARKGVWALAIVAALQAGSAVIIDASNWVLWVIAGVFAALALWAMRAPLVASVLGLAVFVLLHGAEAFVDPSTLAKGVLMKAAVVVVLVGAIRSALKHREFRMQRGAR
jgi:hypothetical protein